MIFYESTSSTIIGKPQVERVNQLQLTQQYVRNVHNLIAIDGVVNGSEEPSDNTLPTEAYVKTYVENNITSVQNKDLSDTTSFLQIVSAPFNGSEYHNFIVKPEAKTLNLNFTTEPLSFLNEGEIVTCDSDLTITLPNNIFSAQLFAKFNYNVKNVGNFNRYSTMFSSVLASQTGWVSASSSGSSIQTGDFCVAFPSKSLSSDIEYTFVSAMPLSNSESMMFFNDQYFDTPRGQFVNLQTQTRTSCKLVPAELCTAYKLAYLFVVNNDGVWSVICSKTKPTIFNKTSSLSSIIDDAWYFNNMTQCWYTGLSNGLRKRTACFVGIIACSATDVVAAWNMPPANLVNPYNTVRLDQTDLTTINTVSEQNTVNIFNKKVSVVSDLIKPELSLLAKCCQYYVYVDLDGDFQIDWKHPYENAYGEYYHPINYWKCVGEFFLDSNYLIHNVLDLHEPVRYDDKGELTTITYEFVQAHMFSNPYKEYTDTSLYPACRHFFAPLNKRFSKNLSYYNITLASAGGNGYKSYISNAVSYATITSSYNDLIMCLEDGRRGNEATPGVNGYGRSSGTKVCANIAETSLGARSTATSLIDTSKYAKGGNSYEGIGGNSGNVCNDQIAIAQLPEFFLNFGTTLAQTSNLLGYARIEIKYYKDN